MKTIEQIKKTVNSIAEKYELEQIDLFGSYAMNTQHTDSDIDLLVKFKQESPSIFDVCGLQEELKFAFNTEVDVITMPLVRPEKLNIERTIRLYG